MSEPSEMADLLMTAREVLRSELVPLLPAEKQYAAAMVANALTLGARALTNVTGDARAGFVALYGQNSRQGSNDDLENRLAADIRRGAFDSARAGRLRALLLERTVRRLKISDPDALSSAGLG